MKYLLNTNKLTKKYKNFTAVNQVDLHIRKGDIYGFIGRNGAGKTTFLKMISGLAHPTSGEVTMFGYSGKELYRHNVYMRIGALIEAPGLYPNMTAFDNLKLKCLYAGISEKKYIEDILERVGLSDTGNKKVKSFSLGMKQRLGIAIALVGEPDLLVLDEPVNGLDPQGIVEVREIIHRLNKEKNITFIISSHILEELSKIATNYGIIHEGNLITELSKEELMDRCRERIELKLSEPEKACIVLERLGFQDYQVVDKETIYIFERLTESGDIAMSLANGGVRINSITVNNESLEGFYLSLTGGASHA
ncbi:ABC transporter ATP-binding protein [Amphibacillus sp. Q70]|uniref:ABC transporter ATP-binding protein n=1 Tax=Amphibacillus sp. Q70 TaxID=3453416 RepID=UPI003F87E50E